MRSPLGACTPASYKSAVSAPPPTHIRFPVHPTWIPKLARASTGKGTPYLVPGCALRTMGSRVMRLPKNTVRMPCHHDMPAPGGGVAHGMLGVAGAPVWSPFAALPYPALAPSSPTSWES